MRPVLPALLLLAFAAPAPAALISVDPAQWQGSRSTTLDGGVTGKNGWAQGAGGFKISWEITLDGGVYTYQYTLSDAAGGPLAKEVSHLLLQVSDSFTAANVLAGSDPVADGGPRPYTAGPGNPQMPGGLYALKFDFGDGNPAYTLVTDRAPVWGSFYAKGGGGMGDRAVVAYNAGFTPAGTRPGSANDSPYTDWIPTPDTTGGPGGLQSVPVPPSFVLMGLGALGWLGLRYRPRRPKV